MLMPPNLSTVLPLARCAGCRLLEGKDSLGIGVLQVPLEID
jgi:hypothetical protein